MKYNSLKVTICTVLIFAVAGCGGAKVKKQKNVTAFPEQRHALVLMSDENISVSLDWVLVRNSPESWAKNADWDEYIFRMQALPAHQVQVNDIVVYDSLGTRLSHLDERTDLKRASKQTIRRYKKEKLTIKPGAGFSKVAAGSTGAILGAAYISGATAGAGGAGLVVAPGAIAFIGTAVLLTPLFITAGIVRGVHHHQVTKEIHKVAAIFPLSIDAEASKDAHVFYPFAPSPNHVEVTYTDSIGVHKLNIDTQQALAGLHMAKIK